jgi:ribosomal protein S6--L-glutamate ligase
MWWDHPIGPLVACEPDVVVLRSSLPINLERARGLEAGGATVVNGVDAHERARSKLHQAQRFAEEGIAHPRTAAGGRPDWWSGGPVVVKPEIGSSGRGVRMLSGPDRVGEIGDGDLVQEVVESRGEFRTVVADGRALGWARRTPREGDFRANLAQGATMVASPPPSADAADLAIRAVASLGLVIGGVDLIMAPEGPVIIEVNAGTTLYGPDEASTDEIVNAVVDQIERKAR